MKKTVLVTGSSRGLGRAIASSLPAAGYHVVLHCRSHREEVDALAEGLAREGKTARVLQFDVADREATRIALEKDIETNGPYYGVVCNAGINRDASFPAMESADWDIVLRTNLDSFYNTLHPIIMPMIRTRAPGRIITISSMSGVAGNRGQVNYSASKGGIIAATKALAIELARRRITVNCVVPGIFETDMIKSAELSIEELKKFVPMQRLGKPEEISGIVRFLLSDDAAYITRQVISVNGGML